MGASFGKGRLRNLFRVPVSPEPEQARNKSGTLALCASVPPNHHVIARYEEISMLYRVTLRS
jgi:hypothetical protein